MLIRPIAALAALCSVGAAPIAQAADKPTDPQIAHIAYTAGVIDIEAAKLAIAKSKNKAVVDFANDMVRDHEAVNVQALDLVKKLNVTPEDNDTTQGADPGRGRRAREARQARRRGLRQGLCRERGRLPQAGQRRARNRADPVGRECRAEEPARNRPEDIPGPPAACRACRRRTEIRSKTMLSETARLSAPWPRAWLVRRGLGACRNASR